MRASGTSGRQSAELIDAIGEAAAVALAEEYAGTRLYVPPRIKEHHPIVKLIGRNAADGLSEHYGRITIRVPLLRKERALHHRNQGMSNGRIAVRLGMTETGVSRIFQAAGATKK